MMITVKDLKNVNSRESFQGMVRKAWVLQLTDEVKAKLQALPQETRFEMYKTLDKETAQKHLELMRDHKERSLAAGAKYVIIDGIEVLEPAYQIDTDELLIEAGFFVAQSME